VSNAQKEKKGERRVQKREEMGEKKSGEGRGRHETVIEECWSQNIGVEQRAKNGGREVGEGNRTKV